MQENRRGSGGLQWKTQKYFIDIENRLSYEADPKFPLTNLIPRKVMNFGIWVVFENGIQ